MPKNTIVAVDIGTSKVSCIIAEYNLESGLKIIGKGQAPSHGINMGVVTDLKECSKAIEIAVIEAENAAGITVNYAFAGISGEHISAGSNRGQVEITSKNHEITSADLSKVISEAEGITLPQDRKVLHVIPRGFYIDGHNGVINPLGMRGEKLEVDAYIITGLSTYLQNISRALEMSEIELEKNGFILSSVAAAGAIIKEEEKKLGILFVDIGAGTTKIAAYKGGHLLHCRTLPFAGDKITYDVAMTLKIPLSEAEGLKVSKGAACPEFLSEDEENEVMEAISFSESEAINVQRKMLAEIIEARLMDIFAAVKREIQRLNESGVYIAGVVLTGGTAKIKDVNYLASRILELPVRIGKPRNINGLSDWEGNPEFAGVVGTLKMALQRRSNRGVAAGKCNLFFKSVNYLKRTWEWLVQAF